MGRRKAGLTKRRAWEEEEKKKGQRRRMMRGQWLQGCSAASCVFVVELMTGIKESEDYRDLCSPSRLHPSQELSGNLIPFGLKSPDKTETLQLI